MTAIAFIAFWAALGIVVAFVAMRGGGGAAGEARPEPPAKRRAIALATAVIYVGFGAVIPALVLAGDKDKNRDGPEGVRLTASETRGRKLFAHNCSTCHTLAAVKAKGRVGPNLDQLMPPKSLVLNALATGAPGKIGQMPPQLLEGRDAQDVAAFVAAVAGR